VDEQAAILGQEKSAAMCLWAALANAKCELDSWEGDPRWKLKRTDTACSSCSSRFDPLNESFSSWRGKIIGLLQKVRAFLAQYQQTIELGGGQLATVFSAQVGPRFSSASSSSRRSSLYSKIKSNQLMPFPALFVQAL